MKLSLLTLITMCFCLTTNAQVTKKQLHIQRATEAPKIDGILDDAAWANAQEAVDFIQFRPNMNVKETENNKTVVKLTYDNSALYLSAHLYDDPTKICLLYTSDAADDLLCVDLGG